MFRDTNPTGRRKDHTRMIVVKEDILYARDLTTLDTLQGITKHLIINMAEIKEGMYLYVIYVITLDTQQNSAE